MKREGGNMSSEATDTARNRKISFIPLSLPSFSLSEISSAEMVENEMTAT